MERLFGTVYTEHSGRKTVTLKTIIVTGRAGVIGSAVIRELIQNTEYQVINLDKLTYAGNLESLKTIESNERYHFEQVDICDAVNVNRVFELYQPDIIMHLAAKSHVDRSIVGSGEFIQANIEGTYTLLEQARAYWQTLDQTKKETFLFHHISTDEDYGDLPHPEDGEDNQEIELPLFTEQMAYASSSPSSASKVGFDHLVRAWYKTYGLPMVITNCSNNYGSYHFPEKRIPLVILNALDGKPLPVYGNGNQIRDGLYVEDHARALILVATEGQVGEAYNIGGQNEKQNVEVVEIICDILDKIRPKVQRYKEQITFVADRLGHDMRYAIDASKIQKELGWKPQKTFESGIQKTVEWYLKNHSWCKDVQSAFYQGKRLGKIDG